MDELLSEKKTSTGVVSLRTVLRLRLLFGFYCPVYHSPVIQFLARFYCLSLVFIISIIILPTLHLWEISIRCIMLALLVEHIFNVLLSLVTGEDHFLHFCKVIEQVDTELGYHNLRLITPAMRNVFIMLCIIVGLFFYGHLYANYNLPVMSWPYIIFTFITSALHFSSLLYITSMDLLRHRLALLRHILKFNLKRHNWSRSNINYQIMTINNCIKLYKSLMDNFNATFSWAKVQIAMKLLSKLFVFLVQGYIELRDLKNGLQEMMIVNIVTVVSLFVTCGIACMPSVFAELVIREVDGLKIIVGKELLDCDDVELGSALELAADYLELRPFKVTFCRLFALDGSLALAFVSLCTTYFIVIVQTTGVI